MSGITYTVAPKLGEAESGELPLYYMTSNQKGYWELAYGDGFKLG